MKTNIQLLISIKNVLQRPQITRSELFSLTKRARNYAPIIKPLNAFTRNIEINSQLDNNKMRLKSSSHPDVKLNQTLKHDIHSLQQNIDLYHKNQQTFDSLFAPSKKIDISAYCCYINEKGIAGFVNIDNIPYFTIPIKQLPINEKERELNELLSIYILLKSYSNQFTDKRVQIFIDNVKVLTMLKDYKARDSTNSKMQSIITKIAVLCMESKINIHWSRIGGADGGIPLIILDRLARSISNPFQYSPLKPQSKPNPMADQYLKDLFA